MRRRLLAALAALALLPAGPAVADDDHERARRAVEAGRIRPLAQLLAEVERRFIGQVVETDLDDDDDNDGRWTYSFKLLPPSGHMYRVDLDAATGAVLRTKGPVQERR
ncbi:PepSY domain-containing protein [Paracraurococcus lichenis]|uniref:PepSY domain-containing protein n=1 Tax=Paracraurococcus lichenis TaxID=3064888 RepID=A0ABT9DU20_9PROT|nr:PepSY domain-containing protein [Paracraurococcus sp. LOR1-02]MDO9707373.1 PepSY domain-containing protein [Paracraurococcus sp. LOR1-02]